MIDHVAIQCADIAASTTFYDALLAAVGAGRVMQYDQAIAYGTDQPQFWIAPHTSGEGFSESHLAFRAGSREEVLTASTAARALGAVVLHEPREWPEYHPGYFAVFVRDPDGNNVEVVYHGD